jgi:hypothetical protein
MQASHNQLASLLIQINGIPQLQWNNSLNAIVLSVYGSDIPVAARLIK